MKMTISEEIKKSFKSNPVATAYKVVMIPVVLIGLFSFVISLIIFHRGFDEAKDIISECMPK